MSDKNIINFSRFRTQKRHTEQQGVEFEIAKRMVQTDPVLSRLTEKLGVPVEETASWMLQIQSFQAELDQLVARHLSETRNSPFFAGLVLQILALECSDRLSSIGQHPDISPETFLNFQRNAMTPIVQARHSEAFHSDDFDAFENGESQHDREDDE